MALLDDVETRLSTQSVAGIAGSTNAVDLGWTIYKGFMPPDPDKAIGIFETGGFPAEAIPELNYPTFQLRVRSSSTGYSTGRQKVTDAETALHGIVNITINGRYYPGFFAMSDAISLGVDNENRPIIAQNYKAMRSRT